MRSNAETYWQSALKVGLIGGVMAVLFSLVGMVEAFNARAIIGGVLSLGHTFVAAAMIFSAAAAARRARPEGQTAMLVSGLLAGLVVGALLAGLVLLSEAVNLRSVFVNASPALFRTLTFGQAPALGAVVLVVLGALLGLATAGVMLLGPATRSAVFTALAAIVIVGVLGDLLRLIISAWGVYPAVAWLFSGKGLSVVGALVVTAIVVAIALLRRRGALNFGAATNGAAWRGRGGLLRVLALAAILAALPPVLGSYMSEVLSQVGLFVLMGLGLNIVVGYAGLLDLGYVAFYALGAYTVAILTSPELGFFSLGWWSALPVALLVAIVAGVILGIPVLKMRGDYLAIVTLGFGEIIRLLALSDWLRPYLGGAQGITLIDRPDVGDLVLNNPSRLYYLLLAACLVAAFVAVRLRDSRMGRAWMAMREDEDVAEAIGINLVATKLLAFATGALFSGLSGAIFAAKLGSIYPNSFELIISINVLALIIIGGMGSIPGVIVGALALVGLPELLREFAEFRLLVYGALLVVMMLYRPEGLWPEAAHKRELHTEENVPGPDRMAEPAEPGEASLEMGRPVTQAGGGRPPR